MAGVDLNLIAKEIADRKKERKQVAESSGVNIPQGRDEFLIGLVHSVKTGEPTKSSAKVKIIDSRAKNVEVVGGQVVNKNTTPINEEVLQEIAAPQRPVQQNRNGYVNPNYNQPNYNNPNYIDPRDEEMYRNIQEATMKLANKYGGSNFVPNSNATLAESIAAFKGMNNPNQAGTVASNGGLIQQGSVIQNNASLIVEQINNAVQGFMNENFGDIVQAAMKSTIIEIYEKEKLEKALNENKDLIQKIVLDTILALKKDGVKKSSVK